MNIATYFEDTYKFSDISNLVSSGRDEKGWFVTFDKTIFYPQGGGQASDQGYLQIGDVQIPVDFVRMVDAEIRHYIGRECKEFEGKKVSCNIDSERRLLNAKLHGAGHLISNILEKAYPYYQAVKGHHFPGECYVEFRAKNLDARDVDLADLNQRIEQAISENLSVKSMFITSDKLSEICPNLPYSIPASESVRIVSFGDFVYQPCGGTHVKDSSELKGLQLVKSRVKGNLLKVNYII